jgi:hypothetical protein
MTRSPGRETEAESDFARCLELDGSLKSSLDEAIKAAKRLLARK